MPAQLQKKPKRRAPSRSVPSTTPPTYTMVGTLYRPESAAHIQAPARKGRIDRWNLNQPRPIPRLRSVLESQPQSLRSSLLLGSVPDVPHPNSTFLRAKTYAPLQQNLDRAVTPKDKGMTSPGGKSDEPGNVVQPKMEGGDDEDSEFAAAVDALASQFNAKGLTNLASYKNPSQKAARAALNRARPSSSSSSARASSKSEPLAKDSTAHRGGHHQACAGHAHRNGSTRSGDPDCRRDLNGHRHDHGRTRGGFSNNMPMMQTNNMHMNNMETGNMFSNNNVFPNDMHSDNNMIPNNNMFPNNKMFSNNNMNNMWPTNNNHTFSANNMWPNSTNNMWPTNTSNMWPTNTNNMWPTNTSNMWPTNMNSMWPNKVNNMWPNNVNNMWQNNTFQSNNVPTNMFSSNNMWPDNVNNIPTNDTFSSNNVWPNNANNIPTNNMLSSNMWPNNMSNIPTNATHPCAPGAPDLTGPPGLTVPGAPKPLTAGPPGLRKHQPSRQSSLGQPSGHSLGTQWFGHPTAVYRGFSTWSDDGPIWESPLWKDEDEDDDPDEYPKRLQRMIYEVIDSPTKQPPICPPSKEPKPPKLELVGNSPEKVAESRARARAAFEALPGPRLRQRYYPDGFRRANRLRKASLKRLEEPLEPPVSTGYWKTPEELERHRRKVDEDWYSGVKNIHKTLHDIVRESSTRKMYRAVGRHKQANARNMPNSRLEKTKTRLMTIEEANEMDISEHAAPLLNMAFATLLSHAEEGGYCRRRTGWVKPDPSLIDNSEAGLRSFFAS
ncbi:hypothetical protein MAPG_10795 [Magnaporthiopsis poae ATCC 64411]|uniref:Uncharacterized protein n=1 Tax=Magnaporthiopsis poae (strain ATCC 64411 / 73-15) TaxID=644358 RepID=A0A0C4EDJ3_MAGP6|nr:hypothetical protein MAPG_10795 [Magnaporthiopsis poae ATCC 64411]